MLSLLAQTAVSFVATVSFAILFQVPREQYVYSGLRWRSRLAVLSAGNAELPFAGSGFLCGGGGFNGDVPHLCSAAQDAGDRLF